RCETDTGAPPFVHADPKEHPRKYQVRNLLEPNSAKPESLSVPSEDDVKKIVMAPDATVVAVNSVHDRNNYVVRAFALPDRRRLWAADSSSGEIFMDPSGKCLGYLPRSEREILVDS